MCFDLFVCASSLLLATAFLTGSIRGGETLTVEHPLRQLAFTAALGLFWHLSLGLTGCYGSYGITRFRQQIVVIFYGVSVVAAGAFFWLYLGKPGAPLFLRSRFIEVAAFWSLSFAGLLLTRMTGRFFLFALRRRRPFLRSVLIVGTNRRAVSLAERLTTDSDPGYRLVGFVDDAWHDEDAPERYRKMLIGDFTNMLDLLRTLTLDEVVLTLPLASHYQFARQVMDWCRQQGILVRCDACLFDGPPRIDPVVATESLLITLYEGGHSEWTSGVKRIIDCAVSATALLTLLPLLAAIALAVRLTSQGPILFSQERLGIGKRRFRMLKFRTMVNNAEDLMGNLQHLSHCDGPTFKLKNDPRVTGFGRLLRKTSLDELPQLLNVLRGDMSLVGPRPLPMRDYNGFSVDWHRRRFCVKPGVTGLWQVSGRSSITFERWMELDIAYIDGWSFWLDLRILLKTIPAVLRGSGAM